MFKYIIPLALFIVMAVFLAIGLNLNPRDIPSPYIGKPAPAFSLSQLHAPEKTLTVADMKGKVWLLNVWASWCVSCRAEHPVLNQMARQTSVPIIGLNYKDAVGDAKNWLVQLGNPYTFSVMDPDGRAGIDWGVYGVPETFVMDKQSVVRYKHTGPVTLKDMQEKLLPLIKELNAEGV